MIHPFSLAFLGRRLAWPGPAGGRRGGADRGAILKSEDEFDVVASHRQIKDRSGRLFPRYSCAPLREKKPFNYKREAEMRGKERKEQSTLSDLKEVGSPLWAAEVQSLTQA